MYKLVQGTPHLHHEAQQNSKSEYPESTYHVDNSGALVACPVAFFISGARYIVTYRHSSDPIKYSSRQYSVFVLWR